MPCVPAGTRVNVKDCQIVSNSHPTLKYLHGHTHTHTDTHTNTRRHWLSILNCLTSLDEDQCRGTDNPGFVHADMSSVDEVML